MCTQEILTRVNEAIRLVANNLSPRFVLGELAIELEAQMRREIANSRGVGNALRTVVAMLKSQEKAHRTALAYPWVDEQGRQCVCDGFHAFRLRNHLPLPERPENAGSGIDLDRIWPTDTTGYKALSMPSAKELRAFIATERAKTGRGRKIELVWSFGPNEPSVNAQYLLDAATVFPNAEKILWNTLVTPLVLTCDDGDFLLLPIRTDKTQNPPATEEERKAVEAVQKRAETIRKAHEDYNAAQQAAGEAQIAKNKALDDAMNAENDAAKNDAMELYHAFSKSEGESRLKAYAAGLVWDPEFDMTTGEFERIVRCLYSRDYAA